MTAKSEVMRLRIDSELLRLATKQAKREERTVASLMRFALVQYLEKTNEEKKRPGIHGEAG